MSRFLSLVALLALTLVVSDAAPATERAPLTLHGRIDRVVTGDTLDVRLASGKTELVHILGVHAPRAGDCFAAQATAETRTLAGDSPVTLTASRRDRSGALFAYVALPSGDDLGREILAEGFAQIDVWSQPFSRLIAYVPVQQGAEQGNLGAWGACAADLEVTLEGSAWAPPGGQLSYTAVVANHGPLSASHVRLDVRPPDSAAFVSVASPDGTCTTASWLGSCSFATIASDASATATIVVTPRSEGIASTRATVTFDPCARVICGVTPLSDPNLANDETGALATVSNQPPPPPPPPTPGGLPPRPGNCSPAYPTVCIPPPPPDLDCADIPYRKFYVPRDIPNPDPHQFDRDQDGVGCTFDDY